VTIADLRRERDPRGQADVTVEFLNGGNRDDAEAVLEDWARQTGYRRIWFDDRVVDLGVDAESPQTASVICSTCGAGWDDSIPEFWTTVRDDGCFPRTCLLCGGELPQWKVLTTDDCCLDPDESAVERSEILEWPGASG